MTNRNSIKHVLFDLDETMYPTETGIMDLIGERINEYMSVQLGIEPDEVASLRSRYYERYGTTGRGLYLHHDVDLGDYFEFVHDLPVEEVLQPDARLDEMLDSLEVEKAIFTNATAEHAQRVLRALQVQRHFGCIIGIAELKYVPKPDVRAYHRALELLRARPEECLLVDDRVRNLSPGHDLGMTTVLVGGEDVADGADYVISDITEFGALMEEI
ncbi:MAG TPA: pyrimidine 5'-nucleotidase [Anaerolineae bacterium]|nr:pyrimidine 5'-nucleotidase [Anaerolineae bacterium]